MKIGLDIRMIENSGIGTTIQEFLDHCTPRQLRELCLFSSPKWKNPYLSEVIPAPYPIYGLRQHFFYPRILKKEPLSLFHMTHYDIPYFYGGPMVVSIFDLIHILFPQFSTKPFSRCYAKMMIRRVSKRARKIIVCSENTKKDLIRFFPQSQNKIRVVYPGVNKEFGPPKKEDQEAVLARYQLSQGYFLYLGNLRGSKNTEGLISAYEKLKTSRQGECPPLVLAGKNSLKRSLANYPKGIHYLGEVHKNERPALYSGALAFLFPSFYEGFGLPPLEAMACDIPVLASDQGSLPEVCGEAALYVNPYSIEDMVEKMNFLIDHPQERLKLIEKGQANIKRFSWEKFTQQTWDVYDELLSGEKGSS